MVEVLVVMFIAAVAFTSFYSVSMVGTRYIIESKNRLGAVALANEKMEIVRNLAYDSIGTLESAGVQGKLPQEADAVANGRSYHISTSVGYFDDPMDGTAETSPVDLIPNDYKIVRIIVSWNDSYGQSQSVSVVSRFVPPGLETSVGGSPLSINVMDTDTLLPIPQASVHITNSTSSPTINDTIATDDNGHIMLPAAQISSDSHISITKGGYETLITMNPSADFVPIYGHLSVVEGFLNTYNYFQNRLADLTVRIVDYQNNPVGNVEFSIGGGKIIGHNALGEDVFNMSNTIGTTDAVSGEKKYSSIGSGSYYIIMNANAQYEFIDYDPSVFPMLLSPESDMDYTILVADKNINALFLKISDTEVPSAPIAGAKVTLTDGAVDIFTDKLSSLQGVVFYPDGTIALENKTYTLKIDADGYVQYSQSITIDELTSLEVNLTKS